MSYICRLIEHASMLAKKHPFTCCPAKKAPKCSKFRVTTIQEKPADILYGTARALTLASEITFLTEVLS